MPLVTKNREEIRRESLVRLRDQLLERLAIASHQIGALSRVVGFDEAEQWRRFEREWMIPILSVISDCYELVHEDLPSE